MALTPEQAKDILSNMTAKAKQAASSLNQSSHAMRQAALLAAAEMLHARASEIKAANARDVSAAKANGTSLAFIDRLTLDDERIAGMAKGLADIADLPDPLGVELDSWDVPSGLHITRQSTALGVIGIIYESRPNVTIDAAGLCIKSGNAALLRGGSDSFHTSQLLADIMRDGLMKAGLPADAAQMMPMSDRALVGAMLAAVGEIDVIVPRGGKSLVARVQDEARVPVFAHLEGICHSYVAKGAQAEEAARIVVNAKMRRTGICGATETLLIDQDIAASHLPVIAKALEEAGCGLKGDDAARRIWPTMQAATQEDWATEYLAPILSVRVVSGLDEAVEHIRTFGSGHTEAVITQDEEIITGFLNQIDSAIVMANASTQFADGGEFGMGAEIGIATGKMHARGPVGAAQLTSFKYVVRGAGQTRP